MDTKKGTLILENTIWKSKDITAFACECFVLDDKLKDFTEDKSKQLQDKTTIFKRYEKEIRRILSDQRPETKENRKYSMNSADAKKFILTNDRVRKYFLPRMEKDKYALNAYFNSKDDELNQRLVDRHASYMSDTSIYTQFGYSFYDESYNKDTYESDMKLILFDFLFEGSLDNMFSQYRINGDAFRDDFERRNNLIDNSTVKQIGYGYSYLDFKLKHPTIYYALD